MRSAFALSELGAKGFARGKGRVSFVLYRTSLAAMSRAYGRVERRNQDAREETAVVILTRNEGVLSRLVALFQLPLLQHKLPPNCLKQLLFCNTYEFRAGVMGIA